MDQKPKQYMRQTQRAQYKDMAVQPCTLEVNYAGSTTLHEGTPILVEAQTRKRKQVWDVKGFDKNDLKNSRIKREKEKVVVLAGNIFPGRNETQHVAVHTSGIVDVVVDPDMIKPATGRFIHKPALSSFGFNPTSTNIPFGTHVDATRVMLGDGVDIEQLDDETILSIVTSITDYLKTEQSKVLSLISKLKVTKPTMSEEEFGVKNMSALLTIEGFFAVATTAGKYYEKIKDSTLKEKATKEAASVQPLIEAAEVEYSELNKTPYSGDIGGAESFGPSVTGGASLDFGGFGTATRDLSGGLPPKPRPEPTPGEKPTEEESHLKKYTKAPDKFNEEFKNATNTEEFDMEKGLTYFILESGTGTLPPNEITDADEKKDFVEFIDNFENATDTSGQFWLALQDELIKPGGMPDRYAKQPKRYLMDKLRLWKSGKKLGVLIDKVSLLL